MPPPPATAPVAAAAASSDVGPLMRNVKNFICRRLDMTGLLDDDFGMELLVAGSIVDLGLSVDAVYEQVGLVGGWSIVDLGLSVDAVYEQVGLVGGCSRGTACTCFLPWPQPLPNRVSGFGVWEFEGFQGLGFRGFRV